MLQQRPAIKNERVGNIGGDFPMKGSEESVFSLSANRYTKYNTEGLLQHQIQSTG